MSTAYALAAVTAVLRRRLLDRMAEADVASVVGTVPVSTTPPDRLGNGAEPTQLNVYLHHVTPNQGWRNVDLPDRDSRGQRIAAPPLALDLHYLLTAYGADPFFAEVLLGHAMQVMHERPVLARDEVRAALDPTPPDPLVPAPVSASQLADQLEQVRFTLETVTAEESSRMWSALQAHYRMTAPYVATVVLIEPVRRGRPSLPASSVSSAAADVSAPVLSSVTAGGDSQAPVDFTSTLFLTGRGLAAESTTYAIGPVELSATKVDVVSDDEVHVDLAALATKPPAGVLPVVVRRAVDVGGGAGERRVASSAAVPVVVRPGVSAPAATVTSSATIDGVVHRTGELRATVSPEVGAAQRVSLLLTGTAPDRPGYTLVVPPGNGVTAPATTTATVVAPLRRVRAGTYVVQVEVDGAQSLPGVVGGRYASPTVTL
jgi:hypothetical protein